MKESKFLEKLSKDVRQNFDYIEEHGGHTDKFLQLMDNPTKKSFPHFSEDEIKYLGDEDLVTFAAVYRSESFLYTDSY